MVRHYVRSSKFLIDIFAVLPLELPCLVLPNDTCDDRLIALLKLNRLLKFYKVNQRVVGLLTTSLKTPQNQSSGDISSFLLRYAKLSYIYPSVL